MLPALSPHLPHKPLASLDVVPTLWSSVAPLLAKQVRSLVTGRLLVSD